MNRALLAGAVGVGGYCLYRALKPRYDFRDKHVVITGGSRGLGLVLARELAARGARLTLCSRDHEELVRAQQDLARRGTRGTRVCVVECDVTDRDRVQEFVAVARQKHGPIDVLINNAGIIQVGPIEEMRVEDFEQALFTNFWGALFTTLAVLPEMHARRTGRIVNIASIGGKIAVPHLLPYSASKFALVGLSQGLRAELRKSGIVVTTVCPGLMRTGSHLNASFKGQREQEYAWFALGGSMPGFSMNAERAARQIVAACARGDAEIVLGLPAKLAVAAQALAPNVMADLTALIDRFVLPRSGGTAAATAKGRDSRSQLPSVLTILSDRAAAANNETLAADLPPPLSTTHSA